MRRRVPERLCLMLGSALVLAAVCLYVYDRLEDARAGAQAASAVSRLRQSQSIAAVSETEQPADSAESLPTEDAESGPESASEPPASSVEREYLGVLTIPALGLELPVQTEWSKANLKVSPCRQCGSTAGGDLVIAAHNYKSHFGRLSRLSEGSVHSGADCAGLARRTRSPAGGRLSPRALHLHPRRKSEGSGVLPEKIAKRRVTVPTDCDPPFYEEASSVSVMMNQNTVPLPTVLWTPKRKPCCWKMALVMERPRPVPCLPASERER